MSLENEDDNQDSNIKNDYSDEFEKVITDFVLDVKTSFPEYSSKIDEYYDNEVLKVNMLFDHIMKEFPEKFFDILYQNEEIFENKDNNSKELLPNIDFVELWNLDGISSNTKDKLWKYLQLILFNVVSHVKSNETFGETAKLFEAIDESEFRDKLEKTIDDMSSLFEEMQNTFNEEKDNNENEENEGESSEEKKEGKKNMFDKDNLPNADDIHNHISSMMEGKLGKLATEIAEETAAELDLNIEDATSQEDIFKKLLKNPSKLMSLVKKVGGKLDSKIKAGDIKESELMDEASELMKKMKDMPGLGNMQDILKNMNIPGMGKKARFNMDAFNRMQRMQEKKDEIREKARKQKEKSMNDQLNELKKKFEQISPEEQEKRDKELMELIKQEEEEEKNEKNKVPKVNKKKKKKKGKK